MPLSTRRANAGGERIPRKNDRIEFESNLHLLFLLPLTFQTGNLQTNHDTREIVLMSKRLQRELMTLMTSGSCDGVSAFPDPDNILKWSATIDGSFAGYFARCVSNNIFCAQDLLELYMMGSHLSLNFYSQQIILAPLQKSSSLRRASIQMLIGAGIYALIYYEINGLLFMT
jgi:hypothetical protein